MRKKITMLLASLFACVGVMKAQPVEGQFYRIKANGLYLTIRSYNGANEANAYGTVPFMEKTVANPDQVWTVESAGADGEYYLKSKSEYYITHGSWNVNAYNTGAKGKVAFVASGDNTYKIKNLDASTWYKTQIPGWGEDALHPFCDAAETGAALFTFETVDLNEFASAITVTYNFTYNDEVKFTQESTVVSGANFPAINTVFPFGVTAAAKPEGNVTVENATQDIALSVNLPFAYAESYDAVEAGQHWYYLVFDYSNKFYLHHDAGQDHIALNSNAVDKENKDIYSWGFVGNPFDGFQVVNRGAGSNMILSSSTTMSGITGSDTWPIMTATPVPDGNNSEWVLTSSPNATNGFYMEQKGYSSNKMNNRGSKLAYWTGGSGAGSTFVVEARPFGPVAELEALVEEAKTLQATVNGNVGTAIGNYSQATANALSTAITTAEGRGDNTVANDVVALQDAMDAVKKILPTVGKYYQIHSSLAAFTETKAVYSDGSNPAWASLNEDDKKFYWEAVATANGGVALKNANDGKYMTGGTNPWTMAAEITAAAELDVKIFATTEHEKGYEYGVILSGSQMHANGHNSGAGASGSVIPYNTNNANSASSWYIVEKELPEFYTVTYNFKYNEEVKYTQSVALKPGAAYPAMSVLLPYGVTSNFALPEGTVSTDAEYNFTLTVESKLPFEAADDVAKINTWYYLQMHTNQPGYIGDIADDKSINVAWKKESDESDNFVWGFAGNVFDGITVVNKGTGLQLTSSGSGNATLTEAGTAFFVAKTTETTENATYGFCLRKKDSNLFVNANYTASKLSHWESTDAGSTFFATECDKEYAVEVSTVGYSTYYSLFRLTIPETVSAYVVAETRDGSAVLEQVTGVLPACTGVILKGEGTHTFVTTDATVATIKSNKLQGSIAAQEVTVADNKVAYILANGSNNVGLYKVALTEGKFTNGANKAYMILDKEVAAEAAMFSFDRGEGTTSIEQIAGDAELVIYDLAGRRVEKMEKGIYIVNGKKVVK